MGLNKWIAGALGWALFGPIGGILAFYFASRAEDASETQGEQVRLQSQRNSFLMSLLVLSAAVIKADGRTTQQEMARLREFFTRNFGAQAGIESEQIAKNSSATTTTCIRCAVRSSPTWITHMYSSCIISLYHLDNVTV